MARTIGIVLSGTNWGAVTDSDATGTGKNEKIVFDFAITGTEWASVYKRALIKLPNGAITEPILLSSVDEVEVIGESLDAMGVIEVVLIGTTTNAPSDYTVSVSTPPLRIRSNAYGLISEDLQHYSVSEANAVATSATAVLAATAMTAAVQTITAAITNPGVPRALQIKGNASGITGNVVITGKNIGGSTITETIALNGSTAVDGAKAFASVTSIQLPVEVHAGTDTVSVGFNDKLGLPHKLSRNTVLRAFHDNAFEATAATVAVSATAFESNTVDLNTALNGKQVDIYYIA